jgi:hypothetical protein
LTTSALLRQQALDEPCKISFVLVQQAGWLTALFSAKC